MALVLYDDCRPFFYNYNVLEIEIKLEVYPGNFISYRQDVRAWIRISDFFPLLLSWFYFVALDKEFMLSELYTKGSDNFQCLGDL